MDVRPETWSPPSGLIPQDALRGLPHHGIGRGFKVSKEEIVGLLVALERFVALDHAAERGRQERQLAAMTTQCADIPHIRLRLLSATETGRDPLLEIHLDQAGLGCSAFDISLALQRDDPAVHLGERRASDGVLIVNPVGLRDGEEAIVSARIREVCGRRR
jgi:L-seryl-tRNA(Ser) seleniumtransferase